MVQRACSDSALYVLALQAYAYCHLMPMLLHKVQEHRADSQSGLA